MLIRKDEEAGAEGDPDFEVIPAVDLLGEEAVRLERGAFDRVVLREADPIGLVRRLVAEGARTIHVVDLEGARSGRLRPEAVARLSEAAAPARVQASGGVRTPADALALLEAGAERVVVGTAAFASGGGIERLVAEVGEALVVAVDVRDGAVVTRGWQERTAVRVEEAVERCASLGVRRLLCTAVERDGTLAGPDLGLLTRVVERSGLPVLAAGGVSSAGDLAAIASAGCEGAIVGRALLEGRLPLSVLRRRVTRRGARSAGSEKRPRA